MNNETTTRPYESLQTSTLAYEIESLKKWIDKLSVSANPQHRPARKMLIQLDFMQNEMNRRNYA